MSSTSNPIDDLELTRKIQKGHHASFALLVKKYAKFFYHIAYRYTLDAKEAEDIVQTVLLKFWEFPYKFDDKKGVSLKYYLLKFVINLSIDTLRKKKRWDYLDQSSCCIEDKNSIDLEKYEEKIKLENCIRNLPLRQKTALELGFYEELPYAEVAIIMNTSLKTVQSLIMRAKMNLKKMMETDL